MLNKFYQSYKKFSVAWRAKYFRPLLKLLADLKITSDQVTLFRLIFLVPLALGFYLQSYGGVIICYLIFWLLDLVDGALARYTNTSHDKGRFLDSVADNFAYGLCIVGFIYWQAGWVWLLAYNILIELTVQILGTIKKCRSIQSDWLIKVTPDLPYFKSIAHLFLLVFLLGYDFINPVFLCLNVFMTGLAIYYLIKIKNNG